MSWATKRASLIDEADRIIEHVKSAGRDLNADETRRLSGIKAEIKSGDQHADRVKSDAPIMDAINAKSDSSARTGSALAATGAAIKSAAASIGREMTGRDVMGTKAGVVSSGTATATALTGLSQMGQVPQSLLTTLGTVQIEEPVFRYLRQSARENNADVVPEGGLKPTTDMQLTPVDDRLRVVAHLSDGIDKFSLADVVTLEQFINSELTWGLWSKVEQQVVSGTGEGEEMRGILSTSGIQTKAFTVDALRTIRASMTAVEALGYTPNTIVLNPVDWEGIETSVTEGSGHYRLDATAPVDAAAKRLWGAQVVSSVAVDAGTALVLDKAAVTIYTKGRVEAEWSSSLGDDFQRNQLRLRVEGRFAVAVTQPAAIVKATLTA